MQEQPRPKDPYYVALGKAGGPKGGKACADGMTPEERQERSRKALAARWSRPDARKDPKPRFWAKVDKSGSCWLWTAGTGSQGYGDFYIDGRSRSAHRVAYEWLVGPVPDGLQIDHLCRNKLCVNPAHMEPVTLGENVLRGVGTSARNARKTHCKRGHPLSGDNLGISSPRKGRYCKRCKAEWGRAKYLRNKAQASL